MDCKCGHLAAAGVGTIGIVDFDIVELSNLQRQIIHKSNSIGKLKTESAKKSIHELNPECNVQIYNFSLNSLNAQELLDQ